MPMSAKTVSAAGERLFPEIEQSSKVRCADPDFASATEPLKDHPTSKNLEMCAEAIRDITKNGDIVLDLF